MIPLNTKFPAICSLLQRVLEMEEKEITQGRWGVEETRQTAWVGPMRTNGDGKVASVICGLPIGN